LKRFPWGHAFFEVNRGLLEKYAQCKDAEQVVQAQDEWLLQLEREWKESRETKGEEDEWAGGNPNRLNDDKDDDHEDDEEGSHDESDDEGFTEKVV
jgi:pre-rRNA-processing protein TSR3